MHSASDAVALCRYVAPFLIVFLESNLAVSVTQDGGRFDDPNHIEVTPAGIGVKKIVRAAGVPPSALVESLSKNAPLELEPNIVGSEDTTTTIVEAGGGPTTTEIYASGEAPHWKVAPNAVNTPRPLYEPGPPGPPGPPGVPGPPGDPGPAEGEEPVNNTVANFSHGPLGSARRLYPNVQNGYIIPGPPGEQGSAGDSGSAGPKGSIGLEGDLGPRGPRGKPGKKGSQGPSGKSEPASGPPQYYLYAGLGVNVGFAFLVFIYSYISFVIEKTPYEYCCKRRQKDQAPLAGNYGGEEWEQ
jgi:hypothetical protein